MHSPREVEGLLGWRLQLGPRSLAVQKQQSGFCSKHGKNNDKKNPLRFLAEASPGFIFSREAPSRRANSCLAEGRGSLAAHGSVQGDLAAGMGVESRSLPRNPPCCLGWGCRVRPASLPRAAGGWGGLKKAAVLPVVSGATLARPPTRHGGVRD